MNSLLKAVTTSIQVWSSHISAMIECKTHHLFSLPKFYCSPRDRIGLCHIPQHWDILIWCSDLRGGNRFAICWIYQSMAMFLVQNALLVLFNIPSLKSENLWSQDTSRSTTVCSILLSIHRESSRKTNKHWPIDPMILWNKHPICTVLPSTFRLPKLSKFWPSNPSSAPCSIPSYISPTSKTPLFRTARNLCFGWISLGSACIRMPIIPWNGPEIIEGRIVGLHYTWKK